MVKQRFRSILFLNHKKQFNKENPDKHGMADLKFYGLGQINDIGSRLIAYRNQSLAEEVPLQRNAIGARCDMGIYHV